MSSDDGFRITLARTADEHLNPDAPVLEVDVLSGGRGGAPQIRLRMFNGC